MKVHSGALKPEDQLTQHLPAQTGSALISTAPAGTAGAHGCREPGAATGKSPCHAAPCHAGGRSEGRTRGEQGWRGNAHGKAERATQRFLQGGLWEWLSLPPRYKTARSPQQPGTPQDGCLSRGPAVASACPFPAPLGGNSVVFLSRPPVPALSTKNRTGIYQCIMLYCVS